ncbi:MAG: hypothetical protein ACJ735_16640 [Actinomycetes bacterium]
MARITARINRSLLAAVSVCAIATAVSMVGLGGSAEALASPVSCTSASAWTITPGGGGATYTITNGAGYCFQGVPYQGDWSVTYSGSGAATVFTCFPGGGGVVSGLSLNVTLNFHNNKTGVDTVVNETWTQANPVATFNLVPLKVTPGNTSGLLETHIFNRCPPSGTPSSYVQWNDKNPN